MAKADFILGTQVNQWQFVHQFPLHVTVYKTKKGQVRYAEHGDNPDRAVTPSTLYRLRIKPNADLRHSNAEWMALCGKTPKRPTRPSIEEPVDVCA